MIKKVMQRDYVCLQSLLMDLHGLKDAKLCPYQHIFILNPDFKTLFLIFCFKIICLV